MTITARSYTVTRLAAPTISDQPRLCEPATIRIERNDGRTCTIRVYSDGSRHVTQGPEWLLSDLVQAMRRGRNPSPRLLLDCAETGEPATMET